jgi:lysophospholipase L1-like esterase
VHAEQPRLRRRVHHPRNTGAARRPRRALRGLIGGVSAFSLLASGLVTTGAAAAEPVTIASDAPAPAPARLGPPGSIAVLGDSISQGTGADDGGASISHESGGIGSPRLRNSWATGDWPGLNSYLQRTRALPGGASTVGINLSANGANMRNDFLNQAMSVPAGTGLVLVQMGGNDLCRPNEGSMTSEADYRAQFRAGLQWLQANRPETLVAPFSVPDIYNLWYIRGAAHQGEYFGVWPFGSSANGPRAARTSVDTNPSAFLGARFLWDNWFGSVIPCQSLLVDPTQPRNAGPTPTATHSAEARRLRVRARTQAFNDILAQECAAVLRCRFDDNALFEFAANRLTNGLLTHNTSLWRFVDRDISTQDHFHPSFRGQQKLAGEAFGASYDFRDRTAPVTTLGLSAPANEHGWHKANVSVTGTATDANGIRGSERRTHQPSGAVTNWVPTFGAAVPSVTVSTQGVTHVEVRSLDTNGNQSASEIQTVRLDKTLPQVSAVTPANGAVFEQNQEVAASFSCSDAGGSELRSCEGTAADGDDIDTSTVGEKVFTVVATDHAGNVRTVNRTYTVVDVTPPQIDLVTPEIDAAYDRHAEVVADYTCTDEPGGSGLATCDGTVPDGDLVPTATIGDHDFTVDTSDNAGNEDSLTRVYTVLDVTAPTIELVAPEDGAVYEHHEEVLADYTCTDEDGGSGIAPGYCEGTVVDGGAIDTSTLGEHTFTVTATDRAGNSDSVTHTYTVIDVTAPTVSSSHRDITYKLGQEVEAQFVCTDEEGGSGVATCDGPDLLDTSTVGARTFEVATSDVAGNTDTVTVSYRVKYAYGEVRQPINADGSSVFRAGSTVPVKFQITDFDRTPVDSAEARLMTVRQYDTEGLDLDEVQEAVTNVAATSGNLFRYDAKAQQYIYNLSTRGMEPGTYQLLIRLDDGERYTAVFTLR